MRRDGNVQVELLVQVAMCDCGANGRLETVDYFIGAAGRADGMIEGLLTG